MSYPWQGLKEQPGHTDDWLMTYADMITLLLCFFVVFLVASITKKEALPKAPSRQIEIIAETAAAPKPQPESEAKPQSPDPFQSNAPFHELGPDDFTVADQMPVKAESASSMPAPSAITDAPVSKVETPPPAPIADAPISLPQIADNLKTQGPAHFEQKGDRILTLEIPSTTFFDSGSATVSEAGKDVLRDVAAELKSNSYGDYQITVEGHTDDTPVHTAQFPSNWELSTARAAAVVQFFLTEGIAAQKLRAAGYADTFPKLPNRDASGNPLPANQAQNRRVVIKLEKIEKSPS